MCSTDVATWISDLADGHVEIRQAAASRILEHPELSSSALVKLAKAAKLDQQTQWAIRLIGQLGREENISLLADLLERPGSEVYWESAQALSQHTSPRALDALLSALKHNNAEIVGAAVVALGERRDESARDSLESLLQHPDESVRYKAVFALKKLGMAKSRETLQKALINDESTQVQDFIKEALDMD